MTQRLAALSYWTIGSPSLLVSHFPPKPNHNVLPAAGPYRMLPVALSNTANDSLTHWTYCVAPTMPFVSGGAALTVKPGKSLPTPSNPNPGTGAAVAPNCVCTTGSGSSGLRLAGM